ncbi:Lrp/AsnC family transcriptional regulator [Kushneria aurantia]|uniref:Lrp/AsnC family transcriptional regulator n=1 Tax=Kushneria aurantia TaxID=504092 RepID=A0ABV6FZ04_9GAMM|nr:winged helix-turn-helix transcriptional regulator [Kushneria aurantia]
MIGLDKIDLAILRALSEDSTATNIEIGKQVNLSGPAAFERIKRLKKEGVILGTRVDIDADAIGLPFLAFVFLKTRGSGKRKQVNSLEKIREIEEIHSTAGQFSILLKVRTKAAKDMEDIFEEIYSVDGVEASETIIVFQTFMTRPVFIELEP